MSDYIDLFTCPIYKVYLKDVNNETLQQWCDQWILKHPGRVFSNRLGYQSENLNILDKDLAPLYTKIQEHCNLYAKNFGVNPKLQVVLNNTWFNVNRPGAYNLEHTHAFSFFSGVYYVNVPEDSGHILFHHPHNHLDAYWDTKYDSEKTFTTENKFNITRWWVPSETGVLYLFPSWLTHSVLTNRSNKNRYSISFNTLLEKK